LVHPAPLDQRGSMRSIPALPPVATPHQRIRLAILTPEEVVTGPNSASRLRQNLRPPFRPSTPSPAREHTQGVDQSRSVSGAQRRSGNKVLSAIQNTSLNEPRYCHSLGLSPIGWWQGRGSTPNTILSCMPLLRMRNTSGKFPARSDPRMRRFSGRYRGGAPNLVCGGYPRGTLGNPTSTPTLLRTFRGEPRSLTIPRLPAPTISPRRQ
jgi:hypothetical protein